MRKEGYVSAAAIDFNVNFENDGVMTCVTVASSSRALTFQSRSASLLSISFFSASLKPDSITHTK